MSTPLSPTIFSPSPFPGLDPNNGDNGASAAPRHMRAYLPHSGMHNPHGSSGFLLAEMVNTRPRFRAPNVNLGILQSPSAWTKVWYITWPIWIYGLVILQSFLDLNSVFCLVQYVLRTKHFCQKSKIAPTGSRYTQLRFSRPPVAQSSLTPVPGAIGPLLPCRTVFVGFSGL